VTSSDGTERSTVYVIGRQSRGGAERAIHTDRDCHILQTADRVFEKDVSMFPDDKPVCNVCAGGVEGRDTQDHSHYNALVAAAEEADNA